MTTYEKFKKEVEAIPASEPHLDLLKRMLGVIEGQSVSYNVLQGKYSEVVEKLRGKKRELSLQTYKALGLERLIVRLYALAETSGATVDYQSLVIMELKPYLTAAGYDFERQRFGIDE